MDDPHKFDLLLEKLIKFIEESRNIRWQSSEYGVKTSFRLKGNVVQIELCESVGEMGGCSYSISGTIGKKRFYISEFDSRKVKGLCVYVSRVFSRQKEKEELIKSKRKEAQERKRQEQERKAIDELDSALS